MSFKQSLLALIKKSLLISRLDILHVKALLHSFEKGRKGLNTDKICKIISHMIICLQNLFMYYDMNTFILHKVHLTVPWMLGLLYNY